MNKSHVPQQASSWVSTLSCCKNFERQLLHRSQGTSLLNIYPRYRHDILHGLGSKYIRIPSDLGVRAVRSIATRSVKSLYKQRAHETMKLTWKRHPTILHCLRRLLDLRPPLNLPQHVPTLPRLTMHLSSSASYQEMTLKSNRNWASGCVEISLGWERLSPIGR